MAKRQGVSKAAAPAPQATAVEAVEAGREMTIKDVALALGMHKSTVSLALSGKGNVSQATCAKVAVAAREMGYEPHPLAQRLAHGASNSLVCLCSGGLDVGLTAEKMLLIQKELGRLALEVPLYTFSEPPAEAEGGQRPSGQRASGQAAQIRNLCRQQPRAIVLTAQGLRPEVFDELAAYQRRGGLVVGYDLAVPLECDQVIFDREDNAYQAARHLIERGHRAIGLGLSLAPPLADGDPSHPQSLRLAGFERALREAGLPLRPEWILRHSTYEIGGAEMARHYLALSRKPTALGIVNDYVALAFMVEVARHGVRVPQDVPLTGISQPASKIAHAVVERLVARLRGLDEPARTITIRGDLVQRQSVATRQAKQPKPG